MRRYEVYGTVSTPMGLFVLFTWWYSIDYLWVEHKMVTTWDIIAENFGFGLVVRVVALLLRIAVHLPTANQD